ncbi:MAG TPA: glycosyltransferase family 4 protein [Candidatus Methylomirabilis sp.]|nr:glycosyltransferase family 4 protein [Candidatus Methylomirabilis sp.]
MKIAVICRPLSFHGGVETATAGLLGELSRRGHSVDLISTSAQEPVTGVKVRRLRLVPQPSVLRLLSFALAARRAVTGSDYDLVQSHERTLWQDIYRAGEGSHRGYLRAMGRAPGLDPQHHLLCALERRIFSLRAARHVVAISRGGKTEIEALYGTPPLRVSLVYNGVDLARFHPDNRARYGPAARAALSLAPDDWVVLFVGSGFERKGLAPLLEGLDRLGDPRGRLVVAGKGDVRPYRELASRLGFDGRVRWLGPRRDVEQLYAAADVVALPARYEPFGNVHLEALASGVPVLSSAHAGGSEVIAPGKNGWIVAEAAGGPIAEGLRALRDGHAGLMSAAARGAAEPFTHAACADAFESLYARLGR